MLFRSCRAAADCAGNPNFRSIYRAQLEPIEILAANVYQGDRMCWPAQHPNPADPFYQDRSEGHRKISKATADSISDPELFNQPQKDAWDGAWLIVYASPNYPYFVRVTGYNPAANQITHSGKLTNPTSYAVLNSLRILDQAGEYVIRHEDGRTMIYLWPHNVPDLLRSGVSVSRRGTAFVVHGQKHIEIRGFTIQKFVATEHTAMGFSIVKSDSVAVRDNDVRFGSHGFSGRVVHGAAIAANQSNNVLIQGNRITDNRRCSGILANPAQRLMVRDNLVRRSGYVGIWLMNVARAEIVRNTVQDNRGVHSNGISVYADSSDILVAGNRVYNADRPFTLQDSTNVAVINNAFVSDTTLAVGLWGGKPQRKLLFLNNLILGPDDQGLYAINKDVADCIFQNNIIGSLSGEAPIDAKANTFRNNIYLSSRQGLFHDSELRVVAINHLFVDHARNDFRLKNSPAVNGGADPSPLYPREAFPGYDFDKDLDQNPRKQGPAVDIGPYEFTPASRR